MNMSPRTDDEPLAAIRVMVTRPQHRSSQLVDRLQALGATVIELPTIEVAPPHDLAPLDDALRHLETYDWIVFTSRNTVHTVCDRLAVLQLPQNQFPAVGAVGPATAAELEQRGIRVECAPEIPTGHHLAEALVECGISGQRVFIPAGDRASPDLSEALTAVGARVHSVVAYRTIQPLEVRQSSLDALRRGQVDAICLASPSALHNLAAMLGADQRLLHYVRLICIGPTTAEAVRSLDLPPPTIAQNPSDAGMVDAVVATFS